MKSCPSCGGNTIISDYIGSKVVSLCSDCGIICDTQTNFVELENVQNESDICFETQTNSEQTQVGNIDDQYTEDKESTNTTADTNDDTISTFAAASVAVPNINMSCPSCHSDNLRQELVGDSEHLVCRSCGYFSEEEDLVSAREFANIDGKGDATYGWVRAPKPRFVRETRKIPEGKLSALKVLQDTCAHLKFNADMVNEAVGLFEQMYAHQEIQMNKKSKVLKDAIGMCCAYVTARDHERNVTIKTLQTIHMLKVRTFRIALKLVRILREKPLSHQGIGSLVSHVLSSGTFSPSFLDKVRNLTSLCEKAWLTQGRQQATIIIPVAYLVWLSEDVVKRKPIPMKTFCSTFKLKWTRIQQSFLKNILHLLVTLARQLPWVVSDINKTTVLYHLDSIIKYRHTVFDKAEKSDTREEPCPSTNGSKNSSSSSSSSDSSSCNNNEGLSASVFMPPSMKLRSQGAETDASVHVFPANIKLSDLDREDLDESEFNEELSSYLLSEREVQMKQDVMKVHSITNFK